MASAIKILYKSWRLHPKGVLDLAIILSLSIKIILGEKCRRK